MKRDINNTNQDVNITYSINNDSGYIGSPIQKLQTLCHGEDINSSINNISPSNIHKSIKEEESIQGAEWYWDNISREFTDELLQGKPDGTFLVRDSLNSKDKGGEYTLTLKKDGTNKLIKIYRDAETNKFGFAKPLNFNSVRDLINFYKEHSLVEYNRTLNIKLITPLSKIESFSSSTSKFFGQDDILDDILDSQVSLQNSISPPSQTFLRSALSRITKDHTIKARAFDYAYAEFAAHRNALSKERTALTCLLDVAEAFKRQACRLDRNLEAFYNGTSKKTEFNERDKEIIRQNKQFLSHKLESILESKHKLEAQIIGVMTRCNDLEKEFNGIKPEILDLHKRREILHGYLLNRGFNQATIEKWIAEDEDDSTLLNNLNISNNDTFGTPNSKNHDTSILNNPNNITLKIDDDIKMASEKLSKIIVRLKPDVKMTPIETFYEIQDPIDPCDIKFNGNEQSKESANQFSRKHFDTHLNNGNNNNFKIKTSIDNYNQSIDEISDDDFMKCKNKVVTTNFNKKNIQNIVNDQNNTNLIKDWDPMEERLWFVGSCDRVTAEHLLKDKPPGTFLVRTSSKAFHALSIRNTKISNLSKISLR
ncbi:phosphatidylinositol 3-kinase regulatory subunit alpha-like isoform X2 [Gordionus sp. m RMFG-2023]|uniref:phosphatidylinositol 3-kinase regulatory subunit alpha-like isoform X2 n=1 Tax=Gordionus sp. m RMFG-2023 TaxID=3053472 RepID=UPI0031FD1F1D